ncbi:MAG: DEAD/DEAH box helicase [Planctomycetes bacterium]|nr:DEAD/DEAH box helicase [Planctomycetota bacterium]MCB9917918.1 DEAD/DEAH box helicase [Planctomycetota bacterium]
MKRTGAAPAPLEPTLDPPAIETFDEWDLGRPVLDALDTMGIVTPTPIQRLAIGAVLEGRDVIAKAETGTGKTLAFGAPLVSKMDTERKTVLALVLCPTRELAQQVAEELTKCAQNRDLRIALVVGGDPMREQLLELQKGCQILVGTPGRVLDLLTQRYLSFPWVEFVVLDEADKMFEIGFLDDIRKILEATPAERQTLLFSATYVNEVLSLAREATRDPVEIATARGAATVDAIEQLWVPVEARDKVRLLTRLLDASREEDTFLVFCERRTDVDELLREMKRTQHSVTALHGGFDQEVRFRVMGLFRERKIKCLLATGVASRGLDVEHVSHVINFGVPRELEEYTHRIGRTGRAGRAGIAITFVSDEDWRRWRPLLAGANWKITEVAPAALLDDARRRPARDTKPRNDEDSTPRSATGRGQTAARDSLHTRRVSSRRKRSPDGDFGSGL